MELREYQRKIVEKALKKNTLVVLPTGLGKTIIAIAVAKERLKFGKVLMLAPTKPLVEQHKKTFAEWGLYGETITGSKRKEKRVKLWELYDLFFATPQTVKNDLDIIPLEEFSLLIFDEAHRAVGNYAYVKIAEEYMKRGKSKLILALTASPGNSIEKIREICRNLYIEQIEFRTESSPDVAPYVKEKKVKIILVDMPKEVKILRDIIRSIIRERLSVLKELGYVDSSSPYRVKLKDLLEIQGKTEDSRVEVIIAQAIKLYHILKLLESYGKKEVLDYVNKMLKEEKKSSKLLLEDPEFKKFFDYLNNFKFKNRKIQKLIEILKREKFERAIVFVNLKDSAKFLENILKIEGFKASWFVGQREGMSQKEQLLILEKFKRGEINVLISTSIGEEGLHIPDVDLVIFYEPVPSALRSIQRKGRTGRTKIGKIYILVTRGGIDSGYYIISRKREREMIENLKKVKKELEGRKQKSLKDFLMQN